MAVQNAAQRMHLSHVPPTTLMTGTTTRIMLDLADRMHGVFVEERQEINTRLKRMLANGSGFATGCGAGAHVQQIVGRASSRLVGYWTEANAHGSSGCRNTHQAYGIRARPSNLEEVQLYRSFGF